MLLVWDKVQPKSYRALRNFRLLDHEFMSLYWIVERHVVLLVKRPVLQVDNRRANKVITQYRIIVPNFYFQQRVIGKLNYLVNFLVELRVVGVFDILRFELFMKKHVHSTLDLRAL